MRKEQVRSAWKAQQAQRRIRSRAALAKDRGTPSNSLVPVKPTTSRPNTVAVSSATVILDPSVPDKASTGNRCGRSWYEIWQRGATSDRQWNRRALRWRDPHRNIRTAIIDPITQSQQKWAPTFEPRGRRKAATATANRTARGSNAKLQIKASSDDHRCNKVCDEMNLTCTDTMAEMRVDRSDMEQERGWKESIQRTDVAEESRVASENPGNAAASNGPNGFHLVTPGSIAELTGDNIAGFISPRPHISAGAESESPHGTALLVVDNSIRWFNPVTGQDDGRSEHILQYYDHLDAVCMYVSSLHLLWLMYCMCLVF